MSRNKVNYQNIITFLVEKKGAVKKGEKLRFYDTNLTVTRKEGEDAQGTEYAIINIDITNESNPLEWIFTLRRFSVNGDKQIDIQIDGHQMVDEYEEV